MEVVSLVSEVLACYLTKESTWKLGSCFEEIVFTLVVKDGIWQGKIFPSDLVKVVQHTSITCSGTKFRDSYYLVVPYQSFTFLHMFKHACGNEN
jgi:hypothetical protein